MRLLNCFIIILSILINPVCFAKSKPSSSIVFQVKQDQIQFDKTTVESASLITNRNGTFQGLNIILRPNAAKQLSELTADNIGKAAELLFHDKKIATVLIGLQLNKQFIITEISKEDAQTFVNSL